MSTFTVLLTPAHHPGAVREGNVVKFGPLHCLTHHGGCEWCRLHGYAETACECGR